MSLTLQKKKTVRRPDDGPPGPPQKSQRANAPSKWGRRGVEVASWYWFLTTIAGFVTMLMLGFYFVLTPQPGDPWWYQGLVRTFGLTLVGGFCAMIYVFWKEVVTSTSS